MVKIAVLDAYVNNPGDLSWEPLEEFGEVVLFERTSREELAGRVAGADIVVSNKVVWDAEALAQAARLRLIALTSTGTNVVDLDAARARGITVCNVPAYSTPDVAQMTFALILEMCLHVGDHARSVAAGEWTKSRDFSYWNHPLIELAGKTLGIVGMGSIGAAVARVAAAFDMAVLFCNRSPRPHEENDRCRQTDFDTVLARSDFISLHLPATSDTASLIGAGEIARMKDGAFLINTARGQLIDERAVADALTSGKLAGFGADVVAVEPMRADNPLLGIENALITPHIAWATYEARSRLLTEVFANVGAFVAGSPRNVVG